MLEPGKFSPATRDELTAILDATWQAITEARRNVCGLEEARIRADKRIAQLEKALQQARRSATGALASEKSCRQVLGALEERLKSAVSRCAGLQQAVDAERVGAESVQKRFAAAAEAVHALEEQLGDSEEQRHAVEKQLSKSIAERKALEDELYKARAGMTRLDEEMKQLQGELAAAQEEIATENALRASEEKLCCVLQGDVDLLRRTVEDIGFHEPTATSGAGRGIDAMIDDSTAER